MPRPCRSATGSCWRLVTNSPDFLGLTGFWDVGFSELKPEKFQANWNELVKAGSADTGGRRPLTWVPRWQEALPLLATQASRGQWDPRAERGYIHRQYWQGLDSAAPDVGLTRTLTTSQPHVFKASLNQFSQEF